MISLKVNRVVDPIGDLQYKPETDYDYMRVRIPSPDGCDVNYEYDTSDPDVDKIIFTRHDGFEPDDGWLNSQGSKVPVEQTVYEVWFDKNKGYQPYVTDYVDNGRYYEFELCSHYDEDFDEDFDEDTDEDFDEDTDVKPESDLDQYDSYWRIEKKTINGKTTYSATVKTNEGVVNKTDLTKDQYRDLIKSLHGVNASDALKSMLPTDEDKKKAIEQADKKAKDIANTATDAYDEFLKQLGVSESGSFWSDFDKIVDSVFGNKSDNFKDKSRNYWRY